MPSLKETVQNGGHYPDEGGLPFEELFRYLELVRHCRSRGNILLVEGAERHLIAVFEGQTLSRMVEVTPEEAYLVGTRQRFISGLVRRQMEYNRHHNPPQYLSELST